MNRQIDERLIQRLIERWPTVRWFVVVGSLCVVGGGGVAAVTRPTEFTAGSWVAAYLVLVGGVAQIALGAGQATLMLQSVRTSTATVEAVLWNVGVGATISGTLVSAPVVTTIGGFATAGALLFFLVAVRREIDRKIRLAWVYQAIVAVVLLSVPIGLALAWIRHG